PAVCKDEADQKSETNDKPGQTTHYDLPLGIASPCAASESRESYGETTGTRCQSAESVLGTKRFGAEVAVTPRGPKPVPAHRRSDAAWRRRARRFRLSRRPSGRPLGR